MQIWPEEEARQWRRHYDEAAPYWGKWADRKSVV